MWRRVVSVLAVAAPVTALAKPHEGGRGTCLITGGSRGIGAACARRLSADGFFVAINYRASAAKAEAIVEELGGAERAVAFQADVSSEAGVLSLFEQLDACGAPPLTALVNNAGTLGDAAVGLDDATPKELRLVLDTNVLGPLLCCREAARRMPRGAAIVNLSSGSAYIGTPLAYAISKGALNSMQHGLIKPLAAKGIRINAVSPGVTDTDLVADILSDDTRRAKLEETVPLGRAGTPAEVAGAVAYLLSPDASYTTGANIRVAGGRPPGTTLG